jgi:pyridoxamine 5'-phosphate oxidase
MKRNEHPLREGDLAGTWLEQFDRWLREAVEAGVAEANAMVLATADAAGRPSARSVLLKEHDERGFVFFTNLGSRKGRELAENPWGSLVFPWYAIRRQVVVSGSVAEIDVAASDEYFATRPYGSRIGAHASHQSSVIASRTVLEEARAEAERRFPPEGGVPRPARWGGLRLAPLSVEFWQGRPDRMHDRLRYRRDAAAGWLVERLSP